MEDIGITAQDFSVWTEPSTRQNATPPATTRPPLKRTHSLEIPDPKNEKNAVDSSASVGGLTEDQNDGLPEVVAKGDGELDELIAVSLHPSTSKPLSIPDATQDIISASSQDHKRRISRKEQIQDLRNTIAHLSQRLRGLRTASPPSSCVDQQASILTRPQSLWERMAIQQLKLIHEAEEENARLKDMLVSQKSTARNIQRLIRRREDDELLLDLRNAKQPKLDNNEEVFKKLLRDIEEIYTSMNRLYDEADMNSVSCSERKQRIIPDAADDSAFVELKDKNTVPFDFKRVERAVWKYLQSSKVRGGERVCSEESKQSQDTSMSCVGFTCPEKGVASYVLEQRVSRRYVEENRIVFVSRTLRLMSRGFRA